MLLLTSQLQVSWKNTQQMASQKVPNATALSPFCVNVCVTDYLRPPPTQISHVETLIPNEIMRWYLEWGLEGVIKSEQEPPDWICALIRTGRRELAACLCSSLGEGSVGR